jgi:biotin carboxyl carrier protein
MIALDEGTTNQGFLLELLGRPELRAGDVDTGWLDRLQAQGDVEPIAHADAALLQAAIALCDAATATERGRFYALARRGRPSAEAEVFHQVDLLHRGESYRMTVCQTGPGHYRVEVDGARIEAEVEAVSEHERRLRFGGRSHRTMTALQDRDLLVEVDGVPHRISRDEGGLVRSHAPGVVVAVPVSAGDEVKAGDVVAVTESMKMELSLTSPVDGRVREVLVAANAHVPAGRPLLSIEPIGENTSAGSGERATFTDADSTAECLQRLAWAVLGYDVPAADIGRIVDTLIAAPSDGDREHKLLEIYADVRALNRPHADAGEALGSPQEHLHAFLRSLDPVAEGLPDRFVSHLETAVAHYGIDGLERTEALEDARYRGLPALPLPAARRAGARRGAGHPHPAPRAGRRRRRRGAARRARPPRGHAGAPRARHRRARPRAALANLRRAARRRRPRGDRGGDGGARRRPGRGAGARRS